MPRDPRFLQIGTLAALLVYGLVGLDFEVRPENAVTIVATCAVSQWLSDRRAGRRHDPRSSLVTSLSLCLLLRTHNVWIAAGAAAFAIFSKTLVRVRGKHVFNPANVGIALAMLVTDQAWVSAGQWGNTALLALAFACCGTTVVQRAERSDITFSFLVFYAGMLVARSLHLHEPMAIPLHRLQSGALLLFAFFMISDPKTTPDSRPGRVLYAFLVAAGAYVVHFVWFRTNGLIWSLFVLSPLVPVLDRLLPARRYEWPGRAAEVRQ